MHKTSNKYIYINVYYSLEVKLLNTLNIMNIYLYTFICILYIYMYIIFMYYIFLVVGPRVQGQHCKVCSEFTLQTN